ncbi:MAG: glycosyltransferase family 4 protein [bacterium]
MRIAILSPIAWRTPPRHYGPWEAIASNHAEGLVQAGHDVTLFATADSLTTARLDAVCPRPYEEDRSIEPKAWECLHIAHLMEQAERFDLIHNHYDFLPLSYSRLISTPMVTTIHGFSSPGIVPVYRRYNDRVRYVSISDANRHSALDYIATVYNGIRSEQFTLGVGQGLDGALPRGSYSNAEAGGKTPDGRNHIGGPSSNIDSRYLLFLGRIHPDKGTLEAIEIARRAQLPLVIAGIVQDTAYFDERIKPQVDGSTVHYVGAVEPVERNRLLGGALALLHPIRFDEPFGLSVAESMMCGTPVIAVRRGSMPELIRHGETGYLVDGVNEAVESVRRLKRDPAVINRTRCREWALSMFSVEAMVDGYLGVYAQMGLEP